MFPLGSAAVDLDENEFIENDLLDCCYVSSQYFILNIRIEPFVISYLSAESLKLHQTVSISLNFPQCG